ncbi:unnamed protein product [Ophioblennius macclurei]
MIYAQSNKSELKRPDVDVMAAESNAFSPTLTFVIKFLETRRCEEVRSTLDLLLGLVAPSSGCRDNDRSKTDLTSPKKEANQFKFVCFFRKIILLRLSGVSKEEFTVKCPQK